MEEATVHSLAWRVPGLTASVFTNDETFAAACAKVFYQRPEPEAEPDVVYSVWIDRRVTLARRHSITIAPDFEQIVLVTAFYPSLLPALEIDVGRRAIDGMDGLCPLSGGAAAWDGRGILVVGDYESGRNLLVHALVERGCGYLADSIAVLAPPAPRLVAFPKSLALRRAHQPLLARHRDGEPFRDFDRTTVRYLPPPPEPVVAPQPIEVLLFPTQDPAAPAAVRPLSRGAALERLVAARYHGPERAGETLPYLLSVAAAARPFSVNIRGLKRTTDLVFERALEIAAPPVVPVAGGVGDGDREEAPQHG